MSNNSPKSDLVDVALLPSLYLPYKNGILLAMLESLPNGKIPGMQVTDKEKFTKYITELIERAEIDAKNLGA